MGQIVVLWPPVLSSCVQEHGNQYFGNNNNKFQKPHKEWFIPELKEIIDQKAKAYVDWRLYPTTVHENKYQRLSKIVRNKVDATQRKYWEELSIDIENVVKIQNLATAFQVIRRLCGTRLNTNYQPVQGKNGLTLTNSKGQLKWWKEYFDQMLNADTTVNENVSQQIPSLKIDDQELSGLDTTRTLGEVVKAIEQVKCSKTPGKDDIPAELLKVDGQYIVEWLHEIIRDV